MESPMMTIKEAAAYLKMSQTAIYVLARSQEFPAIKVGNSWRVIKKELDKWIERQYAEKPENLLRW